MDACCEAKADELNALRGKHRTVLVVVLLINAALFVVEAAAGLLANSSALLADSLDMLGDSLVYGFSLYVLWRSAAWKAKAALVSKPLAVISILSLILGISFLYSGDNQLRVVQAAARVERGEKIYLENCAACHGQKGDGKGPEVDRLQTKPRDFTTGNYKFRSNPSGSLPLDQDIFRTISRGVRATSMLAQLHLSENERWAVTEYLKTFSNRFKTEKPLQPIAIPAVPSSSRDLITLGKTMYTDAGCNQCHGAEGKGNTQSTNQLKDESGNPIAATDLTLKPFKSGPSPEDLYRTLSTGLNGTPMPSYADALAPKERWALVFYILSIATQERPRGMMGLVGEEVEGMRIDMRAAMAGMMGGRGMMGRGGGMMDRNLQDMRGR